MVGDLEPVDLASLLVFITGELVFVIRLSSLSLCVSLFCFYRTLEDGKVKKERYELVASSI